MAPDAFFPDDSSQGDASDEANFENVLADDIDEPDCYETIMAALYVENAEHAIDDGVSPTIDEPTVLRNTKAKPAIDTDHAKFDATVEYSEDAAGGTAEDSESSSDLPDRVGKFKIKRELGRGAFGVVYLGYDEELQRNVAIKVSLVSDPQRQEKLKTEASKAAQVESPGIVPVYHIGTTEQGLVYIVHKFIPGCTLRDVLKQGPISPARATSLMRDLACAMAPAHQLDILHRDLKPDNVLIDERGNAWIADFGLAISESEQAASRRELAGTPPYMSPEQIKGRVDFLDPRSDLWALGVMYYELLSGKLPFRGKDRASLTEQICERDPRPLQQYAPNVLTNEINQVFLKACAKQPSDRYATVIEFAAALDNLLDSGLSEQNILGETSDQWFGDDDSDFLPLRSRSQSQMSRGSMTRNGIPSSDGGFASAESIERQRRLVKSLIALVAFVVVGLIGAAVVYRQLNPVPAIAGAEEDLPAVVGPGSESNQASGSIIWPDDDSPNPESDPAADPEPAPEPDLKSASDPPQPDPEPVSEPEPEPVPLPQGTEDDPMTVAADGSGSHATLTAAIMDAPPNGFIRLSNGSYSEAIKIEKPLTIMGPDHAANVPIQCMLQSDVETVVQVATEEGRVTMRGISIVGKGTQMTSEFNAVEVTSGVLVMQDMDLTTSSYNCIKVLSGAVFGAQDCRFYDSRTIAVSAKDHAGVQLVNCRFQGSGVELIGGAGTISGCEFFGAKGVWCKQNKATVQIVDCKFNNGRINAVAALEGGRINIRDSHFLQGDKAIQVLGGDVVCQAGCLINDFSVGAFVSSGTLELKSTELLESGSSAIQIAGTGKVQMQDCKIEGASTFGIDMVSGSLDVSGSSINACRSGCINLDSTSADGDHSINASLVGCTLSSSNVGIAIRHGKLTLDRVTFNSGGRQGSGIGVFADGSDIDDDSEPVSIGLTDSVHFDESLQISIYAKGNVVLDASAAFEQKIQSSGRLLAPAKFKDPVQ